MAYLLLLFLPGITAIELFKLGKNLSFAERLAFAFGLSMAIDAFLLLIRTSQLPVPEIYLGGIWSGTVYAILSISIIVMAILITIRRKFDFYTKITRIDLIIILITLIQSALVYIHFSKYPVFPQYQSIDFEQHVRIARDIQLGYASPLQSGVLYYGVHLLMSPLIALTNNEPLIITQHSIGILAALSPLLVYSSVSAMTDSKRTGIIATLLYVGSGFIWFGNVFNVGLYSNFYGLLAILFTIISISLILRDPRNLWNWLVYALAMINGYFSHFTFLTILPVLLLLPLIEFIKSRSIDKVLVRIAIIAIIPALASTILRPNLITIVLGFLSSQGGGSISGDTALSQLFTGIPVIRFTIIEITNDVATLMIFLMTLIGIYSIVRQRKIFLWIPIIWVAAVFIAAPYSEAAWRFSYVALAPITIIASIGINTLLSENKPISKKKRFLRGGSSFPHSGRVIIIAVILLLIIFDSWSYKLMADATTYNQEFNQAQYSVYEAIQWISQNTPAGSKVLSVTDWRFIYLDSLAHRNGIYAPLITPDAALQFFKGQKNAYIALTRLATLEIPPESSENPFNTYPNDPRFQLVYNNSNVNVYEVLNP
jgi:hypothetical protein